MKLNTKIALIAAAIGLSSQFALAPIAMANQANPNPIMERQPDGTVVEIRVKGDEHFHWSEDKNGYTVIRHNGWYKYATKDNNGRFSPILWDMNMAFGTFKNGLPQPVTTQDLQELDIFHGSTNNQNKMCTQMFSSDQYRRMYVAHMRTILNEQFTNNNYSTRALQLQAIIDSSVNADPNGFYTHTEFISNISSSIGTQNSIVGIMELMGARILFIQSLPEFTATPPTISNIT